MRTEMYWWFEYAVCISCRENCRFRFTSSYIHYFLLDLFIYFHTCVFVVVVILYLFCWLLWMRMSSWKLSWKRTRSCGNVSSLNCYWQRPFVISFTAAPDELVDGLVVICFVASFAVKVLNLVMNFFFNIDTYYTYRPLEHNLFYIR